MSLLQPHLTDIIFNCNVDNAVAKLQGVNDMLLIYANRLMRTKYTGETFFYTKFTFAGPVSLQLP